MAACSLDLLCDYCRSVLSSHCKNVDPLCSEELLSQGWAEAKVQSASSFCLKLCICFLSSKNRQTGLGTLPLFFIPSIYHFVLSMLKCLFICPLSLFSNICKCLVSPVVVYFLIIMLWLLLIIFVASRFISIYAKSFSWCTFRGFKTSLPVWMIGTCGVCRHHCNE